MPKYTATLAYDSPSYAHVEFEAADDAEAIAKAKKMAAECDGDYATMFDLSDDHRVVDIENEEGNSIAWCIPA
jgi:hypothetical protein